MSVIVGYETGAKQGACNPATNTALPGDKTGVDVAVKEISGTIPLPTGAATEATASSVLSQLLTLLTYWAEDGLVQGQPVSTTGIYSAGASQWVAWDGFVDARQAGTWNIGSITTLPAITGTFAPTTRTSQLGTITASAQSVTLTLSGATGAVVLVRGTYTALNGIFEASWDGTNYYNVQAYRLDSNTIETTTGSISSTIRGWKIGTRGASHLRLRATAFTSGTATVELYAAYFESEPIPGVASHAVTLASTTITSVTPGTTATLLGKAIDAVPGATDTGVACLMQRVDAPGTLTPASNDYALPRLDSNGRQWVNVGAGTVAATQSGTWNINAITTLPAITGTVTATQAYTPITWGTPVSTVVTVAAQVTAANASRKALQVWCESGEIYYRFGANPSTTVYHGRLGTGQELRIAEGSINTQSFCALAVGATATVVVTEAT